MPGFCVCWHQSTGNRGRTRKGENTIANSVRSTSALEVSELASFPAGMTSCFFEQIAPLNNLKKISMPLFVVQGGNDPRIPMSAAEQMIARVKSNGSPVWYLMAKDEGHGFRKKSNADF